MYRFDEYEIVQIRDEGQSAEVRHFFFRRAREENFKYRPYAVYGTVFTDLPAILRKRRIGGIAEVSIRRAQDNTVIRYDSPGNPAVFQCM